MLIHTKYLLSQETDYQKVVKKLMKSGSIKAAEKAE